MPVTFDTNIVKINCPFCNRRLDLSDLPAFSTVNCPACDGALIVPKWLQNFLLEELLYSSKGLQVFRALDPALDREVCVKLLFTEGSKSSLLDDRSSIYSEKDLADFLKAFRDASTLNHGNIAAICSCSSLPGAVYGATRYIEGCALNNEVQEAYMPDYPELLHLSKTALETMNFAAEKNIIHGHLTAKNILLDQSRKLYICDFLHAQAAGKDISEEVYTAPELRKGQNADLLSDIYSLAVCLYELAAGQNAFQKQKPAFLSNDEVPAKLNTLNQEVKSEYAELLDSMLKKKPQERPQSYEEILEKINNFAPAKRSRFTLKQKRARKILLSKSKAPRLNLINVKKKKKLFSFFNLLLFILSLFALILAGKLALQKNPALQEKIQPILDFFDSASKSAIGTDIKAEGLGLSETVEAVTEDPYLSSQLLALRPRPADYDFRSVQQQSREYLAQVPEEYQEIEKERIRILGSYKAYLLSKIQKIAYAPEDNSAIQLKNGREIAGSITMFSDEANLSIRTSEINAELIKIPWSELPSSQFLQIAHWYVQRNVEEISELRFVAHTKQEEVYYEFLYLIIVADWYQERNELKKICQQAEGLPIRQIKERLEKYIIWPL